MELLSFLMAVPMFTIIGRVVNSGPLMLNHTIEISRNAERSSTGVVDSEKGDIRGPLMRNTKSEDILHRIELFFSYGGLDQCIL